MHVYTCMCACVLLLTAVQYSVESVPVYMYNHFIGVYKSLNEIPERLLTYLVQGHLIAI